MRKLIPMDDLVIPEDLTTLSAEELAALSTQAREAFAALYGDGENIAEESLSVLETLVEGIEALDAETALRSEAQAERADTAAALAARIAVEDTVEEVIDEETTEVEDAVEEVEEVETVEEAESLAASARQTIRVNMAGISARTPKKEEPTAPTIRSFAHAAPETGVFATGQGVDFLDMGKIIAHKLSGVAGGRSKAAQQFGVATISKPFAEDRKILSADPAHVNDVLDRATSETSLPGGSLVASGGWCAPSETIYDITDNGESREGLVNLPEVQVTRGGLSFTRGISFATAFANGFAFTEANDIAGVYDGANGKKKEFRVPCPEFVEERLAVAGVKLPAGLLQARAYPEVIADAVRQSLIAHDHRISGKKIAKMATGSTAVTMPANQVGAAAPILTATELQVEHYRQTHRLGRSATLEAIYPFQVRGMIRTDLSRRLGVDLVSVSDERIDQWFADRGVRPQFVYNWQDVSSTAASGFNVWPSSVDFLLYRAGTWVGGSSEIITLDTIYSPEQLGVNDYTELFTEEGWLVAKRGLDSRKVTVNIDAGGGTAAGETIGHNGASS